MIEVPVTSPQGEVIGKLKLLDEVAALLGEDPEGYTVAFQAYVSKPKLLGMVLVPEPRFPAKD